MKTDKKTEKLKSILRTKIRKERSSLSNTERLQNNKAIENNLFSVEEFLSAKTIFIYCSFDSEADTFEIINKALLEDKKIIMPRVEDKHLGLYYVENLETELKESSFGILEPDISKCAPAKPEEIDAAIVPGICFDKNFNRLGYGGGYYDRIISLLKKGTVKIALAFDLQLVEEVPVRCHDKKIDIIITETKIYRKE